MLISMRSSPTSSSPPTPTSPLPVSVAPGNGTYPFSSSPSPSPPFSPRGSSSSPESSPRLLSRRLPGVRCPAAPSAFSVDKEVDESNARPAADSWTHLKNCLGWLVLRLCSCCSSLRP